MRIRLTRQENQTKYNSDETEIAVDDYVYGVVASEIGNAPLEACKALAVAARTNAMPYINKNAAISDVSPQAFRSSKMTNAYRNAEQGSLQTSGEILFCNNKIAEPASFSANNGGRTTSSKERWGSARAWLIEQDDPWDTGTKRGHGVGMSQLGAINMAKAGRTYKEILAFYYPNTEIRNMNGQEVKVVANSVKASYLVEKFKLMADEKWKYVANSASKGAVDCSGAFSYWYQKAGSYMYHGSNTMWRKYTTQKGQIGSIELVPGMAVFKKRSWTTADYNNKWYLDGDANYYHVGLYIGNGMVVEAKSKEYGVVYSDISTWGYAARLKNTEYDLQDTAQETVHGIVTLTSGKLNVRSGPTITAPIVGRLENGATVDILETKNGWHRISKGWISAQYVRTNTDDAPKLINSPSEKMSGDPYEEPSFLWKITCLTMDEDALKGLETYLKTNNITYVKSSSTKEGAD